VPKTIRPAELFFFSMTERLAQIPHQQDPLERLNAVIDWVFPRLPPKVRVDDQLIPACPCARFWTAFPSSVS
jgi:hypothetical protein